MCWYNFEPIVRRVSDGNVRCFKVLCNYDGKHTASSYHFTFFKYTVGETYLMEDGFRIEPKQERRFPKGSSIFYVNKAFHSYSSKKCRLSESPGGFLMVNEPIFSADLIGHSLRYESVQLPIAECTIPEGCSYYENFHGEIVSEGIRIDSICTADEYIAKRRKLD